MVTVVILTVKWMNAYWMLDLRQSMDTARPLLHMWSQDRDVFDLGKLILKDDVEWKELGKSCRILRYEEGRLRILNDPS